MKSLRDYINLIEGEQLEAAQTAPATAANKIPPQIANMKTAKPGQEVWLNGTRYKFDPKATATQKPDGTYSFAPGWKVTAKPGEIFQLGDTRAKSSANYTSPELGQQKPAVAVAKTQAPQQAAQPAQAATPAPAETPAAAPAAAPAPAAPAGPWPAGSPQDAAWQKLSPEDQKWIGQADPTDQIILSRAPNGGKPATAPAVAQGAQPAPAPVAGATQDMGDGSKITTSPNGQIASTDSEGNPYVAGSNPNLPKNQATATATPNINDIVKSKLGETSALQNDELTRLVSLVKHR